MLCRSQQAAPYLTGDLRDSGRAYADGDTAVVTYYHTSAAAAHENTTVNYFGAGRGAKFLETTMNAMRDDVGDIIARAVRDDLDGRAT